MSPLTWIVIGGLLMSAIALVGSATLLMKEKTLERIILPLVAFAAGSLLGGALFHMLPAAAESGFDPLVIYGWTAVGFVSFFALEQLLHWHHCQRASSSCRQPLTYLILIGDALHNFLGGLGVGGVFLIDTNLGMAAWLAAAAHEVPQELGDFGVLVHGGWAPRKALFMNLLSGLTFLLGGLLAWALSSAIDVSFLVPLAAGNFIYIAASDLVPEVTKHQGGRANLVYFLCFVAGLGLMWMTRIVLS
ncbi:MAG TPA: ZIP family metal transporter [Polyangiales bacterium]|nr:ZIP family metal transporter [Polyangiales bacterium]